jgi:hypothetical protein
MNDNGLCGTATVGFGGTMALVVPVLLELLILLVLLAFGSHGLGGLKGGIDDLFGFLRTPGKREGRVL